MNIKSATTDGIPFVLTPQERDLAIKASVELESHRRRLNKANAIAIAESDLVGELSDALLAALPYVTDCEHSTDFKPGAVKRDIRKIRVALAKAGLA